MAKFPFRPSAGVCLALSFLSLPALLGQMQPHVRYNGKLLPLVAYDGEAHVSDNGKRKDASLDGVELRPSAQFGEGEAIVTQEHTDLDPLKDASPAKRSDPVSTRFRYEAEVSSKTPLKNCYGVLTLVVNGSVGTNFVSLGSLQPGQKRHVKIELPRRMDGVGHLHVFSNGLEVRSNQVTAAYDAREYFGKLVQGTKGIPAVALCKSEDEEPHVLSDNGSLLATIRENDTHKSLIIYDLAKMQLLRDIKLGDKGETAWSLTWISDHELAYVVIDYSQGDWPTYLMLLDVSTGKTERLERNVGRIFTSLKKQRDTLVVYGSRWQYRAGVTKYNVRDRKLGSINGLYEGTTYFDDNGEECLRYEPDGDRIILHYRAKGGAWKRLDDDVKQPGLKFDRDSRNVLDRMCEIHSISPEPDTIYISTRLNSDRFDLAAFSLSKGTITKVVASHPKYDLAGGNEGASRLLYRKGTSELIGVIYDAEKPQVVWLDPDFAAVQALINKALPDHLNLPVDWSVAGNTFIYLSASDQDPGTYYVLRPYEGQLIPLLVQGEAFKGQPMGRTTPFDFTARDGAAIHAYLTRPPDQKPGEVLPLVVDIHGGPTARDSWGFSATNQFLATRGYLVLQVNYRGSSGYGAAYQKAGLYHRFDTVILDDIADGVNHLIKSGEADPHRVAVMGGSFGGWATYLSLMKYPDLFRSGIAIAAVSHWKSLIKDTGEQWDGDYGAAYWKSLLNHSDFEKSEPFIDPLLRAAEIKQPIYIMHGENDYTVLPTEAKMMIDAVKKNNPNVESMSFPHASHTDWPYGSRVAMLNEIEGFLRRTLPPASPPPVVAASGDSPGK